MPQYIWFTAQTGLVDFEEPKAPSNYHRFKLHRGRLAKVEMEVARATVGSGGLDYRHDFYTWLASVEVKDGATASAR